MAKRTKPALDEKLSTELHRDLEKIVEGELAVEELTASKMAFLKAWLKDDLTRAGEYLLELGDEIRILEERAGDALLDAADPTKTVWPNLMHCIKNGQPWALAGERVVPGEILQCLGCGYRVLPPDKSRITPCHRCGYGCFRQLRNAQAKVHKK